jgi:hypothetical protein
MGIWIMEETTMKNKLLMGAAALALFGVLGHFGAKPLLAQIRAALVKNIDEPGRSPYQSTKSCSIAATNVLGLLLCDLTPVPTGKRLVIQHISSYMTCPSGCFINYFKIVRAANAFIVDDSAFIPPPSQAPLVPGNCCGTSGLVNLDVRLYLEPGDTPEILISFEQYPATVVSTVTGYLVDLNQ